MTLREALAAPQAEMHSPPHLAGHRFACAAAGPFTYTAILRPDGTLSLQALCAEPGNWQTEDVAEEEFDAELSWQPLHGLLLQAEARTTAHKRELSPAGKAKLVQVLFDSPGDYAASLEDP